MIIIKDHEKPYSAWLFNHSNISHMIVFYCLELSADGADMVPRFI
jgi:hypothetical protein